MLNVEKEWICSGCSEIRCLGWGDGVKEFVFERSQRVSVIILMTILIAREFSVHWLAYKIY